MLLGHIRGGGDLDTNCDIIMIYYDEVCKFKHNVFAN
jgi:hypothetical protein